MSSIEEHINNSGIMRKISVSALDSIDNIKVPRIEIDEDNKSENRSDDLSSNGGASSNE